MMPKSRERASSEKPLISVVVSHLTPHSTKIDVNEELLRARTDTHSNVYRTLSDAKEP